jgi:hypothetical protein
MKTGSAIRLAILFGLMLAFIASRWPYPGFPAPVVIAACFLLGFLDAKRPWRWPLVLAAFLLLEDLYRLSPLPAIAGAWVAKMPYHNLLGKPTPFVPNVIDSLISLVPGMAAAYLGVWSRQLGKLAGQSLDQKVEDPGSMR